MKPILLVQKLGESTITLPTYGVLVTLGIALGIIYVFRTGRRDGYGAEALLDLAFGLVVSGLIGARIFYVVMNAGEYAGLCAGGAEARSTGRALVDCLAPLRFWDGGLVFYGGALAAALYAWRFARKHGWSFLTVTDLFAPGLVLGHAVGRLGCLAAGCCYGHVCPGGDGLLCVRFPAGSVAHEQLGPAGEAFTAPLYATQVFESVALFMLFAGLVFLRRRPRRAGFIFASYLVGYGALRLVLELYRGGVEPRFVAALPWPALARALGLPEGAPLVLSTAQLVSLFFLVAGLLGLRLLRRAAGPAPVR